MIIKLLLTYFNLLCKNTNTKNNMHLLYNVHYIIIHCDIVEQFTNLLALFLCD